MEEEDKIRGEPIAQLDGSRGRQCASRDVSDLAGDPRGVSNGEKGSDLPTAGDERVGVDLPEGTYSLDITKGKEPQDGIDALTHTMIQALERERARIALDLHDQVAQDLSSLRLALQTVRDEVLPIAPDPGDRIAEISENVREIIKSVRDISYELVPPGLADLGLASTVRRYLEGFSVKNRLVVQVTAEEVDAMRLDFDVEINLFRVIQEALNNIAAHAGAKNVGVELRGTESKFFISIKDDGSAFDVEKESAAAIADKRMGLWSMRQRVGLLRGKIDIFSSPGTGTTIVVAVPVGEEEHGRQERRPHCG